MHYEWVVTASDRGKSLLEFLQARLASKSLSMRKIKGWIDAGFCKVQGKIMRFYRSTVSLNEKISLDIPDEVQKREPIQILFEDDDLVIIDKPAGYTCDERLVNDLEKLGKKIELVHRLDKETSGVLILAKSKKIKDYFVEEFRNQKVFKRYLAVVDGIVKEETGSIENYLGPIERYQGHVRWGVVLQNGHLALTDWKVAKRGKKATLLVLVPHTGRTHQLRIHTSNMGHPILGDSTYAKSFRCPYKAFRVLLHAEAISFTHPKSHTACEFKAPIPGDMKHCLEALF
jgi:23S rRNA pseudouridine955/2504/2580 synthase/23S rRNA pseudouridine1911/1915/1917 synthase